MTSTPQPADSISVRRITPDDWATFRDLRIAALQDTPQAFGASLEQTRETPDEVWQERMARNSEGGPHAVFLAEVDGRAVGMMGGYLEEDGAPNVWTVWVHPEHRASGIADALLGQVVAWASHAGHSVLRLHVWSANERARAFYRRHGFTDTGVVLDHPLFPGETEHQMELALSPA